MASVGFRTLLPQLSPPLRDLNSQRKILRSPMRSLLGYYLKDYKYGLIGDQIPLQTSAGDQRLTSQRPATVGSQIVSSSLARNEPTIRPSTTKRKENLVCITKLSLPEFRIWELIFTELPTRGRRGRLKCQQV